MKHQFYICQNPKAPGDARYVYHAKAPRFFAEISPDGKDLAISDIIDQSEAERLASKFKRMQDWYRDYLINKR